MNSSSGEAVFSELLDRSYPKWFGIARAYALDGDREDLLQEIMLQVWKSLPKFAQQSRLDTWAYRVALNTALAWNRNAKTRNKHLKAEVVDLSQITSWQNSPQSETKLLDRFLQSLSKIDRAVMLVHLDGLTSDEATEVTGLSAGALRVRLHRLKQKFQANYCDSEAD